MGGDASAIFDAAEQARVEAIGALAMPGVKQNLAAILAMRCKAHGLGDVKEQIQAPLTDVLGLMVRERLTGEPPPAIAKRAVDLWRPFVEAKVGIELDKLKDRIRDQRSFAKLTRHILTGLELAEEYIDEPEGEEETPEETSQDQSDSDDQSEGEETEPSQVETDQKETSEAGEEDTVDVKADMSDQDFAGDARRQAADAAGPAVLRCRTLGLQGLHLAVRRGRERRRSVRRRGADAAAQFPRSAIGARAGPRGAAREQASAPVDGTAEPLLGLRSRRRNSRHRTAFACRHRSDASALLQDGARDGFPRHRGHAPARQFGLDARTADHGGGDVRRYPVPHARTLRGQGRGARFHHAGLEGRPIARALARRQQARSSGAAERSSPHHLQGGRRAGPSHTAQSRPDDARRPAQGEHRRRGADLGA